MLRRAFRFRLAPTAEQEGLFRQFAGVTRLVYNLALEQRRDWWRQYQRATGHRLDYVTQGRQLTLLRAEYDWIRAVHSTPLTQALRDLDRAFASFFAGRSGLPQMRRRGANDSFRYKGSEVHIRSINGRWGAVRLPKVGWVKFRSTRPIGEMIDNVTVIRDALGWHVSFACKILHEAPVNDNPDVGIDRGVAVALALSTGERFTIPGNLRHLDKRRRRAQRELARCRRGSIRRRKRLQRLSRISARIARIRADWHHRASVSIARRFGHVALEGLKIANMTAGGRGKRGLNRSILEQGWGGFALKLAYKLEERGGALDFVNPAYSSQTCSECGAVDRESRKSQAVFLCTSCGHRDNADTNAAKIILRRSTSVRPVEGRGCAPAEPGTCLEAA